MSRISAQDFVSNLIDAQVSSAALFAVRTEGDADWMGKEFGRYGLEIEHALAPLFVVFTTGKNMSFTSREES